MSARLEAARMARRNESPSIVFHRCPVCGKRFYGAAECWAYVGSFRAGNGDWRDKIVCSWKCLRIAQARKAEQKKRPGRPRKDEAK